MMMVPVDIRQIVRYNLDVVCFVVGDGRLVRGCFVELENLRKIIWSQKYNISGLRHGL